MGGGSSFIHIDPLTTAEPLIQTVKTLMARSEARKRRQTSIRNVFFCHTCYAFSYDSTSTDVNGAPANTTLLTCPHPGCIQGMNGVEGWLEEIPPSIEGSLRLQTIMVQLINSRSAQRQRTLSKKPGVPTVDFILGTDTIDSSPNTAVGKLSCSICNDEFACSTCVAHPIESEVLKLKCGHSFHLPCILPWFEEHRSCPCCRMDVAEFKIIPSVSDLSTMFSEEQLESKVLYAVRTKSFRVSKEVESTFVANLSLKKGPEDKVEAVRPGSHTSLTMADAVVEASRKTELSNHLHTLLIQSSLRSRICS